MGMTDPHIKLVSATKAFTVYRKTIDKLKMMFSKEKGNSDQFWALKGMNFEFKSGEIIGIIGFNESGKSTLCQLITEELTPNSGKVEVIGNVGSVSLEDEMKESLTGRDYIKNRFAKKGINKHQLQNLITEITKFSDLADMVDQPLENYSREMKLRLSVTTAIYNNPDILIIDEALSLSHTSFFKNCKEKFSEFQNAGKIIIYVSQDTNRIKEVCTKVLWLHFGKVQKFDQVDYTLLEYEKFQKWFTEKLSKQEQKQYITKFRNGQFFLSMKELYTDTLKQNDHVKTREDLKLIRESLYQESNTNKMINKRIFFILTILVAFTLLVGTFAFMKKQDLAEESEPKKLLSTKIETPENTTNSSEKKENQVTSETANSAGSSESEKQEKSNQHVIKSGDTISQIAEKYNVSVSDLKAWNNLISDTLEEGKNLILSKPEKQDERVTEEYHVVTQGETLSQIAERYQISIDKIREYNFLQSDEVGVGQRLRMKAIEQSEISQNSFYTVQSGDTLYSIAKKYQLSEEELKSINQLASSQVKVGQQLNVANGSISVHSNTETGSTHVVQAGDTLYSIAKKYGVSVEQLKSNNNLSGNEIAKGQQIAIP